MYINLAVAMKRLAQVSRLNPATDGLFYLHGNTIILFIINIFIVVDDSNKLQLLEIIGQGSFGTVHVASWRGSLITAKVIPVQLEAEETLLSAEIDIRYNPIM